MLGADYQIVEVGFDVPLPGAAPPTGRRHHGRAYHARLPEPLIRHFACRIVDELEPIEQKHTIEGLVMGAP